MSEASPSSHTDQTDVPASVVKKFGVVELSDVRLIVGNTEFHVHKMILANRSKYFQALFFGNFKENKQERIDILGADPLAFERMLDVIYDLKFRDTSFLTCGEKKNNTSKNFWEQGGNLFTALDRFDVPHGKAEFFKEFVANWCKPEENTNKCAFCVNRYVFCAYRDLRVTGDIPFLHTAVIEWAERHFEGVPESASAFVFQKLLLQTRK